ncbi:AAA family ATPase [Yinghuangia seranimata]|uniref:AAA family ATPase n=1 Tax=Yinghuangia seranimata TaxID=408067 RepID=UPI00248AFE70|nr:AAA family ATPase [Yinghuangia seranimata]MDI2132566.1 AAA family ATPase [Yinghuangia seranimata]
MELTRPSSPGQDAAHVTAAVLADLASGRHRGVVVDSPPGAGKSTLVVRAAAEIAGRGDRLMIVAQTNNQVDDLLLRLVEEHPGLVLGRLSASDYRPGEELAATPVQIAGKAGDLDACEIVVSTAAKWALVEDRRWAWAIVDEAYQMRSDALLLVARLFDRALFVGDPGQLDPFATVDAAQWHGLTYDPSQSAVAVLRRHNPDLPVHRLPVSWRLPATAAPLVSEAFYPFTPFRSGTGFADRELEFERGRHGDPYDRVVDVAAGSGWGLLELPSAFTLPSDEETIRTVATLAARVLARRGTARSERGESPLDASRIAVGVSHREQRSRLEAALLRMEGEVPGAREIVVDTANRLQGREFDVTVFLHPLSGRRDATAFHLETGRLCVLASRHRHACLVVARAGIPELLDAHPSAEPVHLGLPVSFPDGWEANQAVLATLADNRVRV